MGTDSSLGLFSTRMGSMTRYQLFALCLLAVGLAAVAGLPTLRPPKPPTGQCVDDCNGIRPGSYQSCNGCDVFIQCIKGNLLELPCPWKMVWDDKQKRCALFSETCREEEEIEELDSITS